MPAVDLDLGDRSDQQLIDKAGSSYWFDRLNGKSLRMQLYQQNFRRAVLPEGMSGVKLWGGYDNCIIPVGCTLQPGAYSRWVNTKNDFYDWIEDEDGNPVEPVNLKHHIRKGLNIDPAKIPAVAIRTEKMSMKEFDIQFENVIPIRGSWFKVKPTIKSTKTDKRIITMSKADFFLVEDNGIFDSEPTRITGMEKGRNSKLPMDKHVVVLKGYQTIYEVEGEVHLFRDARKEPR